MLEKPALSEESIQHCLRADYGLPNARATFLPLGADVNTAVYRVSAGTTDYFLKLRSGSFAEAAALLPQWLSEQGNHAVIPAVRTRSGAYWAQLEGFTALLYPFVAGRDGYKTTLSAQHWADLGAALKQIHSAAVPADLRERIQTEHYSPHWREMTRLFLRQAAEGPFVDIYAQQLAYFLRSERGEILALVERAERLAHQLPQRGLKLIVCHADLHAGNLLIGSGGELYIVDWDTLTNAPKERDLMYIGGGLMGNQRPPAEEEALFYRAYGPARVDPDALAYYRYERIVEDIAAYCEQLFLSPAGGEDRPQALRALKSCFLPGGTIAIARQADPRSGA